jgi:hypothetical protein
MVYEAAGFRCVGRCNSPAITRFLGNMMRFAVSSTPLYPIHLPGCEPMMLPALPTTPEEMQEACKETYEVFKMFNDIRRPGIDTMPICAVVLDKDQDPAILPGWQPLDQMEAV